jgi:hypothetical protein
MAMVGRKRCARLRVHRASVFRRLKTDRDQERYLDTVDFRRSSRHGPTTFVKSYGVLNRHRAGVLAVGAPLLGENL